MDSVLEPIPQVVQQPIQQQPVKINSDLLDLDNGPSQPATNVYVPQQPIIQPPIQATSLL